MDASAGAFVEHDFLKAFEDAEFYGVEIITRQQEPWAVVEGIEFRSMTVRAYKGKEGPCNDHHQAVVYRGPWQAVTDDEGHVLRRGERMAVCEKTFQIYQSEPYADSVIPLPPAMPVSEADAQPFDCHSGEVRLAEGHQTPKRRPTRCPARRLLRPRLLLKRRRDANPRGAARLLVWRAMRNGLRRWLRKKEKEPQMKHRWTQRTWVFWAFTIARRINIPSGAMCPQNWGRCLVRPVA